MKKKIEEKEALKKRKTITTSIGVLVFIGGIMGVLGECYTIDESTRATFKLIYIIAGMALAWVVSAVVRDINN